MGKIDRSNYEIHFLDYIDGNLSVDLVDDFLEFLKKNPDLKEELQTLGQDPVILPDEKIRYSHKNTLLKDELTGSTVFDYHAVACMEGDLTNEEKAGFEEELQNDLQKREAFYLMKRLRLQPQSTITFPDKNSLLKHSRTRLLIWPGGIAAVFVLGLLIWTLFPGERHDPAPHRQAPAISENQKASLNRQEHPQQAEEHIQQIQRNEPLITAMKPHASELVQTSSEKKISKEETIDHPRKTEVMAALKPRAVAPVHIHTETIGKLTPKLRESRQKAEYTRLTDYLAQKLLDTPQGEDVTLASIAKAGLQAAEHVSGNKFNIERSDEGKIAEISLNTRLFGFSIPVKKNK